MSGTFIGEVVVLGASLRQNGQPLTITRTKLEHQRRQIQNARVRTHLTTLVKKFTFCIGGKGLNDKLKIS